MTYKRYHKTNLNSYTLETLKTHQAKRRNSTSQSSHDANTHKKGIPICKP